MTRGRFITFEGGEGVGKSTQARLLAEALRRRGLEVVQTREPGGTGGAERIRELLLDPANKWSIEAEALLFAAARADHVGSVIRPALDRGGWVVCDRYLDSSRAYQGGRLRDDDILELHRIGSGGLLPDCTLVLQVEEEAAQSRLTARDGGVSDRIAARPPAYHRAVMDRFRAFAAAEPARFVLLDAEGTPDEVHAAVLHALAPLLEHAG